MGALAFPDPAGACSTVTQALITISTYRGDAEWRNLNLICGCQTDEMHLKEFGPEWEQQQGHPVWGM